MPKRRSVAVPEKIESKPRFFRRPVAEIPTGSTPVYSPDAVSDEYFQALLSDKRVAIVRENVVFDTRDEFGNGVFVVTQGKGDEKKFRIEITIDGLRLFKTFDREQASKLCDNVDYEMRKAD